MLWLWACVLICRSSAERDRPDLPRRGTWERLPSSKHLMLCLKTKASPTSLLLIWHLTWPSSQRTWGKFFTSSRLCYVWRLKTTSIFPSPTSCPIIWRTPHTFILPGSGQVLNELFGILVLVDLAKFSAWFWDFTPDFRTYHSYQLLHSKVHTSLSLSKSGTTFSVTSSKSGISLQDSQNWLKI